MAGEGTGHGVPWEIGPGRSQLSLGPACGGSELTPPWTLRLSPGHRASFAALPALWPIFHGPIPASFRELGVGAGGPTQGQGGREAACLSVYVPGLVSGTAQRAEPGAGRQPGPRGSTAPPQLSPSAPGQLPALSDAQSKHQAPICRGLSVSQNWLFVGTSRQASNPQHIPALSRPQQCNGGAKQTTPLRSWCFHPCDTEPGGQTNEQKM